MSSIYRAVLRELINSSSDSDDDLDLFGIHGHLDTIFSTSDSSSDESEKPVKQPPKMGDFMRDIDKFNDQDFNTHFRMKRSTVEFLIRIYYQSEEINLPDSRRPKKDCRKDIFMYIWYMANISTYEILAIKFGETHSSSEATIRRVCNWLISIGHEYVKWPQGEAVAENCRKFEQRAKIPGVLGAVDSTRISVTAPSDNKDWYFNRHNYSIVLQAVVDADKKFIDICCGEPGSQYNFAILKKSRLSQRAERNFTEVFPNNTFIVGDLTYAPSSWLVPPYKDNDSITDSQSTFNLLHAATRVVAERTLELLKGRFHRLSVFNEETNFCTVTDLIVSACVLHNICIIMEDVYTDCMTVRDEDESSDQSEPVAETSSADSSTANRRRILFNHLLSKQII